MKLSDMENRRTHKWRNATELNNLEALLGYDMCTLVVAGEILETHTISLLSRASLVDSRWTQSAFYNINWSLLLSNLCEPRSITI